MLQTKTPVFTIQERSVQIGNVLLAKEVNRFSLRDLLYPKTDTEPFDEVIFQTLSGNMYAIYKTKTHGWVIADAKSNRGNTVDSMMASLLSEDFMKSEQAELVMSHPFFYGNGANTTAVMHITLVCTKTHRSDVANLPRSNARKRFIEIMES